VKYGQGTKLLHLAGLNYFMGGRRVADVRTLLAYNLKRLRKIWGISQMALAERVGCSTTLIGNIEIKKRFPSAENIDRLAKALNVRPMDLFVETDKIKPSKKALSHEDMKSLLEKRMGKAITNTLHEVILSNSEIILELLRNSSENK
jgi:transcriptional regulator with XRE-family HTH domain